MMRKHLFAFLLVVMAITTDCYAQKTVSVGQDDNYLYCFKEANDYGYQPVLYLKRKDVDNWRILRLNELYIDGDIVSAAHVVSPVQGADKRIYMIIETTGQEKYIIYGVMGKPGAWHVVAKVKEVQGYYAYFDFVDMEGQAQRLDVTTGETSLRQTSTPTDTVDDPPIADLLTLIDTEQPSVKAFMKNLGYSYAGGWNDAKGFGHTWSRNCLCSKSGGNVQFVDGTPSIVQLWVQMGTISPALEIRVFNEELRDAVLAAMANIGYVSDGEGFYKREGGEDLWGSESYVVEEGQGWAITIAPVVNDGE